MLKRLFQRLFTAAVVFAPMTAFADGPGGAGGNGQMMNGVMLGHGAFGPIMALLLFAVTVGIIFIAIKLLVDPEKRHGTPPA